MLTGNYLLSGGAAACEVNDLVQGIIERNKWVLQ